MTDAIREVWTRSVNSVAATLALTKLPDHANLLAASFLGFTLLQFLTPIVSSLLFPVTYNNLNRRAKQSWSTKVVSQAHAFSILPLAWRCFGSKSMNSDRAYGWSEGAGTVHAVACGYFLWDTLESIVHFTDIGFVIHGSLCLAIYSMSFTPFLAYYGVRFLFWELSTPFLNNNWFLDKTGQTGGMLQYINGFLLLSTFAASRLIYGGILSYRFFITMWEIRNDLPLAFILVYGLGNLVLQTLNWAWFRKMIASFMRRLKDKAE